MERAIIKEAEFDFVHNALKGAISTVKDKTHFIDKPFETAFGILGPMGLWKINKWLGIIGFILEVLGVGPGRLGQFIDEHVGKGSEISEDKLKGAADSATDSLISGIEEHPDVEANLKNIFIIKNAINENDVIASICLVNYNKQAGLGDIGKRFFGMSSTGRGAGLGFFSRSLKLGISGMLWALLKTIFKSLFLLGIVGGAVGMFKGKEEKKDTKETKEIEKANIQHYTNVANNTEDTIIEFLDATIANFSKSFEFITKQPLKGSARLKSVLEEIAKMNWTTLDNVNQARSFVGPKIVDIAKRILPEAKYEKISYEQEQKKIVEQVPKKVSDKEKQEIIELTRSILK
jgi:hypothetical protein